ERVKKNAEGQKAVSLGELSKILDIPEEVLARTREAASGELSSPEYWLEWYRRTLATTAAAKRANRNFRSTPIGKTVLGGEQEYDIPARMDAEDDADKGELEEPGGVFLVRALPPPGKPKPPDGRVDIDEFVVRENVGVELSEHPPVVGAVSPPNGSPVDRGKLPAEWRGLVRRVVHLLVRLEEIQNGSLCLLCQTAKPPIEVLSDGETVPRREQDLRTRASRVVDHFVDSKESALRERVLEGIREAYEQGADEMRLKITERSSPCRKCRERSNVVGRPANRKQVGFDCSSLNALRSEALGTHCSTEEGDGVLGYVNVISDPERWEDPGSDELRSTNQPREEWTTAEPFQEGKRVIASVQGVEALSTGFIDCVPADLLIDSGAVACLVHSRVLKRIGRSTEPLRSYTQSLNAVSGHSLKTRGVIDLQLRLGSLEKTIPFVVVDQLHVDAILGTDALKEFKAVIDLEDNVVTLKETGEAFPIGSPRVLPR
ncbi:hypothetical protein L916_17544, partial [Phytophthora nicotianae]